MFKHTAANGRRNVCGLRVAVLRKALTPKTSQRALAELVQLRGVDIDKSAIKRIENGERYVTDIEILIFCDIFNITPSDFLDNR